METTTLDTLSVERAGAMSRGSLDGHALVLLWSTKEPWRTGEVLAMPPALRAPCVFGRGAHDATDRYERVFLTRRRPAREEPVVPVADPFISRAHWKITREAEGLRIENVGRRSLLVEGHEVSSALVREGDLVEIRGQMLFLCQRGAPLPRLREAHAQHPFGEADEHGFVGESAAAWALRDAVAFVAGRHGHVLITGPSGAGKELAARAVHALSARAPRRFVSRNAATIPPGLIDAELFGSVAGYPNAGLPERPGLIGEADGGTLFLDEISQMPAEAQGHLLRVLDAGGEYQRLGDARRRASDVRVIAATNRAPEELQHDFLARFTLCVHVPGLEARREDVPLLVRHMLRAEAARDARIGAAFLDGWDGRAGEPRVALPLIAALVRRDYATHARELRKVVWRAICANGGPVLDLAELAGASPSASSLPPPVACRHADDVTPEDVRAALVRNQGVRERAWRDLGLSSRHVLMRLLKRYGIDDE